jgi:hypothetical protein
VILGCDIAWQKPTGAQLAAVGVQFASLYVGQDNTGKNMTPAVVADYAAHGVSVITNFEYGATQMLGAAAQGRTDAALGLSQARACGMPDGRPIIYSADWAATAAQINSGIIPYLAAARDVTGPGTVGVYGSYSVVTAVNAYWAAHFPGEHLYVWQTVAWSGSSWATALEEIEQLGGSMTVGGITIDQDYAPAGVDVGQWILGGGAPTMTMNWTDLIDGIGGRPGGNHVNYMLTDLSRMRDHLYGDSTATVPADSPLAQILALPATVAAIEAQVKGLSVPSVDAAALAEALAGNTAFVKAIAHAFAVEIHNDTPGV